MVVLDIYKRNIKTIYKTTLLSKATFFVLITTALSIILPYLLLYKGRDFWLTHDKFYEQPNIRYKGEFLFVGLTNNRSNMIICNNFRYIKQLEPFDACSIIKAREMDNNWDNKKDAFNFQIELNLPNQEYLQHFTLLLTLDYRLQTVCPLNMQAAILLQQNLLQEITTLDITANLKLVQNQPLLCYNKRTDIYHNYPLIMNELDIENYKLQNILAEYAKRNVSTHLDQIYSSFDKNSQSYFKLNLFINYPIHEIYYTPRFWQAFKWLWVQYISVYLVFAWIFKRINNYIFDNNLLLFYKVTPFKNQEK